MDDAPSLRRKAARCFEMAAAATTDDVARALTELGEQFQLWADEIERQSNGRDRLGSAE